MKLGNKIFNLISREHPYRLVFYKVLKYCEMPRISSEVEQQILLSPEMKTAIHSPSILLGWLEEFGGIKRIVVDGEDEKWQTTDIGKKVAEMETPRKRLLELVSKEPGYSGFYMQILRFCETPRTSVEIEDMFRGNTAMEQTRVHPTFFIQRLEDSGGLEWVDKKWRTAEAAKGVFE